MAEKVTRVETKSETIGVSCIALQYTQQTTTRTNAPYNRDGLAASLCFHHFNVFIFGIGNQRLETAINGAVSRPLSILLAHFATTSSR